MTTDPATIADALSDAPVYVHPQSAAILPPDRQDTITATLEDSPVPVYVVVTRLSYDDAYGGSPGQLLALVHDELGEDGVYAHVGEGGRIEARGHGYDDEWEAASVANDEPTAADGLERFVELVASGTGPQVYDEVNRDEQQDVPDAGSDPAPESGEQQEGDQEEDTQTETSTGPQTPEDAGSMATAGAVIGLLLLGVIAVVVIRQQIKRARAKRYAGVFEVPDHVAAAVHSARTATVDEQARATTLALGESIERTEPSTAGSALAEYQAALDAYDAARRTLDRSGGIADLVGALVLAELGQAHLARSTGSAGTRREPIPRTCFFDPLHGVSAKEVPLPGRSDAHVPACAACAARVRRNAELAPLMISDRGRLVPYYESGAEPWASTGYGALSRDLVERVLTGT